MENKDYYGITVGPISHTINLTSSPGGLWMASFLFSYIVKKLVKKLTVAGVEILIPTLEDENQSSKVGSYPDHIIFSGEIEGNQINSIINEVKEEIASMLFECWEKSNEGNDEYNESSVKDYINKYINIYCVKVGNLNGDEIFCEVSKFLDNLELSRNYIHQDNAFFLDLFSGEEERKNEYIKNFLEVIKEKENVRSQVRVNRNGRIKKIDEIAKIDGNEDRKINDYYAIVFADGDNMTTTFASLNDDKKNDNGDKKNNDKKVINFSAACLKYTKKCAELIGDYGGVTIFAGGDDLLFLAPLANQNDKTLFDLFDEIRKAFVDNLLKKNDETDNDNKKSEETKNEPTVSFGVAITYKKFPIYEGLQLAQTMLFNYAKTDPKNNLAIKLSKASGQTIGLIFNNDSKSLEIFNKILKNYFIKDNTDESRKRVHSVIYLLEKYEDLFDVALDKGEEAIKNFFINMYDNPTQTRYKEFIDEIIELYKAINEDRKNNKFKQLKDEKKNKLEDKKTKNILSGVLRLAKFYIETKE